MTITDPWSMALAPVDVYDDPFDDAPDCLSRLYVPKGSPLPLGSSLACTVDHQASGLEWLHGALVAGHCKEWTTADAADSLAVWLAAQGPRCDEPGCKRPAVTGGMCGMCANRELAADNYETPEVEAA